MSLQFVLGNSGSGKTEYIYQKIVKQATEHPKKNYLVIVPEQFTMQTQKKLVELAKNNVIMNIDVLCFKRLAYRVFDELGKENVEILEETGKNLVLRKLAQEQEKNLTVLRANMNRMGYIGELKSFISELMQYNVSPEQLLALAKREDIMPLKLLYPSQTNEQLLALAKKEDFPSVLQAKLFDIVTMYQAFRDYMDGRCITAEEILNVLKDLTPESGLLRDSVIVFDEFTGFTPVQNTLLREFLLVADSIYITLTIDAGEDFYHSSGNEELFALSKKTVYSLMRMAEMLRVPVLEPVVLGNSGKKRFAGAPSLAFLEQNLFRKKQRRMDKKPEEIHLSSAGNPKEELALAAREINRLVRSGYRYREIAVVTGAVEAYRNYIEPLFSKYRIPYFMDTTKEVLFHPFIEMIRAVLEIVADNYSYEAMMRFLRCGFCRMEEDELDRLDNYLLAMGIQGEKAWNRHWIHMPKQESLYHLAGLENLREQTAALLAGVSAVFADKQATVHDGICALYGLFVTLDVQRQLWEREAEYLKNGEETKAKEYEQIYQIVIQLLEKFNLLLGKESLDIDSFTEILDAGLSAASVAVIPPGYDSVTIGDIERTRLNHIKVLFFVGVNDGIIPKASNAGGIVSEYEREFLLARGMELAPSAREQAFIQRFYLYRSLTKPSERLYISYAKVDGEGKAIRPSYLIGVIRKLFPGLVLQEHREVKAQPDFYTEDAALDYLIHGTKDASWFALAKWFLQGSRSQSVQMLLSAAYESPRTDAISRAVARALYGKNVDAGITRLERFAACACAHYLQYGLKLREREVRGFESVDMGNLYHTALEHYSRMLEQSEYDWFHVTDEARDSFADAAMEEAVLEYPNLTVYATAGETFQMKRMKRIFSQTVWALTKQVQAGKFTPDKFEISFSRLDETKALRLVLDTDVQMQLSGRIDRIDSYKNENEITIKVIDYKSGSTKFDLVRIYQGLQLQLMVYLDAALELEKKEHKNAKVIPGGVLYYHIDDPVIEGQELTDADAEHALLMALRPDGVVNSDESVYLAMDENLEGKSEVIPVELKKTGEMSYARSHVASTEEFELVMRYVRMQMKRQGKAVFDGDVRVNPYKEGTDCSCNFCPYRSVCGIDSGAYQYRRLSAVSKDEVYERMETELALAEHEERSKEHGMDKGTAEGH